MNYQHIDVLGIISYQIGIKFSTNNYSSPCKKTLTTKVLWAQKWCGSRKHALTKIIVGHRNMCTYLILLTKNNVFRVPERIRSISQRWWFCFRTQASPKTRSNTNCSKCSCGESDAAIEERGMEKYILQGQAKLVEVKGPRDRLSEQQRAWIVILLNAGLSVEVCKVLENLDRS